MPDQQTMPGFGDADSLLRLAESVRKSATTLEELRDLVNKDVLATVPQRWKGTSAKEFKSWSDRVSDAIVPEGKQGSVGWAYRKEMVPAAAAMRRAKELLAEAERYVADHNLHFGPNFTVAPNEDTPEARAHAVQGQGKLDVARQAAEKAREQVRRANANLLQAVHMSQQNLDAWGTIFGGRWRRGGRGRAALPRKQTEIKPMGTKATLGKTTKPINDETHRKVFFEAHPELENRVWVHHAIEQQALDRYPGVVTPQQLHSLENLRGIPNGATNNYFHLSMIRNQWDEFYRTHPTATLDDLLQKATEIDDLYGRFFNPPIR